MLTVLMLVCIVVIVIGVVMAMGQFRRGTLPEKDGGMSRDVVKHPIRSNPVLIWFILFPVIVFAGSWIWMYYSH